MSSSETRREKTQLTNKLVQNYFNSTFDVLNSAFDVFNLPDDFWRERCENNIQDRIMTKKKCRQVCSCTEQAFTRIISAEIQNHQIQIDTLASRSIVCIILYLLYDRLATIKQNDSL